MQEPAEAGDARARRIGRWSRTGHSRGAGLALYWAQGEPMDATAIFLSILVGLTALLGIGALVGLLVSAWFILLPLILLAMTLAFADSGFLVQAVIAGVLLAAVTWTEYRVWRG